MTPILQISNLSLGYAGKVPLLSGASATLQEGELIGLMGMNGSGKSTLLRTISGISKPLSGEMHLREKSYNRLTSSVLSRTLAFVSPSMPVQEDLTVLELVRLGRHPYTNWWGNLTRADHQLVDKALGVVGMEAFLDHKVEQLSDGERQRVLIALALAQDTPVILLDEPLAFLDVPHGMDIAKVMVMLKERGKSVIFSTHDPDVLFRYCDKAWLIHEQRILEGAPEDLGIAGAFDQLFNRFDLMFDLADLRFKPVQEFRESVKLSGDQNAALEWTKKALLRNGYEVNGKEMSPCCTIELDREGGWKLVKEDKNTEFQTLYDMIRFLTQTV